MQVMNVKYLNWLIERDLDDNLRRRYKEATNFPVVLAKADIGEVSLVWAADDATDGKNKWQSLVVSVRGVEAAYEVLDRIHKALDEAYKGDSPLVRLDMVRRPFQMPYKRVFDRGGELGKVVSK